jgi:hypothetical protein
MSTFAVFDAVVDTPQNSAVFTSMIGAVTEAYVGLGVKYCAVKSEDPVVVEVSVKVCPFTAPCPSG